MKVRLTALLVTLCLLSAGLVGAEANPPASSREAATYETAPDDVEAVVSMSTARGGEPESAPDTADVFPICSTDIEHFEAGPVHSYYVRMRDGVRIALDVILPTGMAPMQKLPAVLIMTRYWRRAEGAPLTPEEKVLARSGFAVVTGDVRGTGASFGTWPYHRSRAETLDFGEIISWISKQTWSDGSVVGYGVSYSANTADWMAERNNPSLKAIAPRFPDFDPYADLYFPGGIANVWMAKTWGLAVKEMDLNQMHGADGKSLPGVRPVDADTDKRLLAQAIDERRHVASVWEGLKQITFRDDRPTTWTGASMDDWAIYSVRSEVERSQIPIQTWGSWFDAGTANGVLHRFMTQSNPQRAFIGAWPHGGFVGASPYAAPGAPASPSPAVQQSDDVCFFDHFVDSAHPTSLRPRKLLAYYTMGEERWKTSRNGPCPRRNSRPGTSARKTAWGR